MPSRHHDGGKWCRPATRLAIYLRDDFRCVWCLTPLAHLHPRNVTLDHAVPRERGGSNAPNNLLTACKTCNSARGTQPMTHYARTCDDPLGTLRRVRAAVRRAPNLSLARAILAGQEPDPRPVVRRARRAGRLLAPKGSAVDLIARGLLRPVRTGHGTRDDAVPF